MIELEYLFHFKGKMQSIMDKGVLLNACKQEALIWIQIKEQCGFWIVEVDTLIFLFLLNDIFEFDFCFPW